jgi:NADH pyrophosphatase NudC (nudix superfamily)
MDFRFCPRCAQPLATRRIDGDMPAERLACPDEACGFVHWGNPVPAVGVIVEHEGEVILARNAAWPPGFFALIAGFLEPREDPVHAVGREVKEELGLDVVDTTLVGNYIFERKNEVMLCYHALAVGTVTLGAELAEYRRHRPAELRPWRRATGLALADWMRSRGLEVVWDERPAPSPQPVST